MHHLQRLSPLIARSAGVGFIMLSIMLSAPSESQELSPTIDTYQIRTIIDRAEFDFANFKMYRDQKIWIGKTVAFRGKVVYKPVIFPEDRTYIEVDGAGASGDPIDIVILLDNALPTPKGYVQSVQTIGPGQELYFFVTLQKCRDLVSVLGYVMYLPTADGLLIFDKNDRSFSRPLWTSQALKRK